MTDFNAGRPGVYFFQHGGNSAYVNLYGNVAMREGDYPLSAMWDNYSIHNDDMSSIVVFNHDDGTAYEVILYEHDNFQGAMTRFRSNDSSTDTASHPSWPPQVSTWQGNGWKRNYYGVRLIYWNDRISSVKVRAIPPPPPPLPVASDVGSTAGFYTYMNGKAYNFNNIVRGGGSSSSKDYYHNSGSKYFSGTPNNTSNLRESTLINHNSGDGAFSIDSMKDTKFKHTSGGRHDLGNYFGAPYGDYGPGNYNVTAPDYCNRITGICVGGGGAGGAGSFGDNDGHGGGGGGSGGAVCGYISCSPGQNINIIVGGGGGSSNREGVGGGGGGYTKITAGNNYIIAYGGGGGSCCGGGGGGGGGYHINGGAYILSKVGNQGQSGVNADDDDDEMDSGWKDHRSPGGGSVYNWTNSGNAAGWAGAGGRFGDDDKFDGSFGDNGGGGWCRVYYTRW